MKLTRVPLVETSPASLRFATGAGSEIKILSSSGSHKSTSSGGGSEIFKKAVASEISSIWFCFKFFSKPQ